MLKFLRRIGALVFALFIVAFLGTFGHGLWIARTLKHSSVENKLGLLADQRRILLVVEDPSFETHGGVSLWTPGAGMTTITQSISKWLMFEEFQPGVIAKLRQTIYALALDAIVSKDAQIDLFVRNAYFGHVEGEPIIGFENAARLFHGKPLHTLTNEEFTSLIARLIAPNNYIHPSDREGLAERTARILNLLAGRCAPTGLTDVYYEACSANTIAVPQR